MYLVAEHLYQKNGNIDLPKKSKKYSESILRKKDKGPSINDVVSEGVGG